MSIFFFFFAANVNEMQYTKLKFKSYDLQRNSYKYLKIILLVCAMGIVIAYQAVFTFVESNMDSMDYYKVIKIVRNSI